MNKTIQISLFNAYNLKPIGFCDIFSCNVSMLRKFLCIIKEENIQGTLIKILKRACMKCKYIISRKM